MDKFKFEEETLLEKAQRVAKDYEEHLSKELLTRLEMDFVAVAHEYHEYRKKIENK